MQNPSKPFWFSGEIEFIDDFRFVFGDFKMANAGGKGIKKAAG